MTAAVAALALRFPRHASEGLPSVSAAAISSPPARLTFLRNCVRWRLRLAGSVSCQKGWPAKVVGTSDPARPSAAIRGNLPVASNNPPPTCTAPLIRTSNSGSWGTAAETFSGRAFKELSMKSPAISARPVGLRNASTPDAMNTVASMGRAIRRRIISDTALRSVCVRSRTPDGGRPVFSNQLGRYGASSRLPVVGSAPGIAQGTVTSPARATRAAQVARRPTWCPSRARDGRRWNRGNDRRPWSRRRR